MVKISEPHVGELLSSNLWRLRGADRDVVIDCGLGVVDLREHVPRMFERDPLVLLTHSPLDHAGGAHAFHERGAHPAEAAVLAEGVPASLYGPELYERLGLDAGGEPIPELLIDDLPYPGYDPSGYRVDPVVLTRQLHEGDGVDLRDRTLTLERLADVGGSVVHPGHGKSFDQSRLRELIDVYVHQVTKPPGPDDR